MGNNKNGVEEYNDQPDESHGKARKYEPEFDGPIKNRSCTDIICWVLYHVFLIGFIFVGIWAFIQGRPSTLLYPTDSWKKLCGDPTDPVRADKPFLYFFDLTACARTGPAVLAFGCPTPQVCVKHCPKDYWGYPAAAIQDKFDRKGAREDMICKYNVDPMNTNYSLEQLVQKKHCAYYVVESKPILKRCVPSFLVNAAEQIIQTVKDPQGTVQNVSIALPGGGTLTKSVLKNVTNHLVEIFSYIQYGEKILQDITDVWWQIIILLCIAAFVSLIWIVIMRWIAGIMTWVTIFCYLAILSFATYFTFTKYTRLKDTESGNKEYVLTTNFDYYLEIANTWLVLGIISAVVLGLSLIILIFLRTRILIAIALIKEGSRAVGTMMTSLLWPIIPFALEIIVLAFWLAAALHVASITRTQSIQTNITTDGGKVINTVADIMNCDKANISDTLRSWCNVFQYGSEKYTIAIQVFLLFMMFWCVNFVIAFSQMTLAGAFASYYFARVKPKDIPTFPILSSVWRCFRYHVGTLAFGSLIITIVQMIRVCLEYIDHKLSGTENAVAKFMVKCLKCCMWCLEKFLRFLNKNAYIITAIYGKNFCAAAKDAFFLIARNIVRVAVVDKVTAFLLLLGKLVIVGGTGVLSFYWFSGVIADKLELLSTYKPELNYYIVPVVIVIIGSYLIAAGFFGIYDMAVDTLFLCFLEDLERNDGSPQKPYYMSRDLMKILGKKNKKDKPV